MNKKNKRTLTWALVSLGVVIIALVIVLVATFPWSTATGFAHFWAQGQGVPDGAQSVAPWAGGPGFWSGRPHGSWLMGGRMFGGALLFAGIIGLAVFFMARRGRSLAVRDGSDAGSDAVEILRRAFAEGRINEEEYKSRLDALTR